MGGAVSNPVDDATKHEIQELIKAVCATFTTQYVKYYAIYLVQKIKDDAATPPSPYKLLTRPPSKENRKTGYLVKEGHIRKNWKKRFFVIKHNHRVEYYENEEESKKEKGKMKGAICLHGYRVIDDPNNTIVKRMIALAEKMGYDTSQLPKLKEYPKFTLELHHSRRKSFFIQAENEEDFKSWLDAFRDGCWYGRGFANEDPVHVQAFEEAVRRTRWELGRWGWWSYGGSEVDILSDIISDQIDYAIFGRIYSKISGSWTVRNLIRSKVIQAIDAMISPAVAAAWTAMSKVVEELRPKIEPKIKEAVAPIGELELTVMTKIREGCSSAIQPHVETSVKPHVGKVMSVLRKPFGNTAQEAIKYLDEEFKKRYEAKGTKEELNKSFHDIRRIRHTYELWNITYKLNEIIEPLELLRIVFSDIWPWGIYYNSRDAIQTLLDNAVYTFEERFKKEVEENNANIDNETRDRIWSGVLDDLNHDEKILTQEFTKDRIRDLIFPIFNALVIPVTKEAIRPIGDAMPEALKTFVDPEKILTQILTEIVNGAIDACVD